MKCYCHSQKTYEQCCRPLIAGKALAKTAEQLMRSRYSAYAVADINYLLNSHHILTRPTKERASILKWTKSVRWMKLEIIATKKGTAVDSDGYVEFKAIFEENGKLSCIHENSYFVKEQNLWLYKSGTHS